MDFYDAVHTLEAGFHLSESCKVNGNHHYNNDVTSKLNYMLYYLIYNLKQSCHL